jgi:hypothetical protein
MTTIIRSHKDEGPYYNDTRHNYTIGSIGSFITHVRSCFESQDDAILIEQDGQVVGLWLREPDVDCDCDGFFEVVGRYPGDEYVLYRPDYGGFWNYVAYHFGDKFVPKEHDFIAQKHPSIAAWS